MSSYLQAKPLARAAVAFLLVLALAPRAARAQGCDKATGFLPLQQTVLDQTTRIPLIGASVTAVWRDGDYDRRTQARTDSLGRALICAPAGPSLSVHVGYYRESSTQKIYLSSVGVTRETTVLDVPGFMIRGIVKDQANGAPVPSVMLRLAPTGVRVLSENDGRFVFLRVPIGDYRLYVEHISYAPNSVPLEIRNEDINAEIQLTPDAILLQPIVVTTFSRRLETVGFYERKQHGIGTFVTRRQVDSMDVQRASDLLRGIPGLRLLFQAQRRGPPLQQTIGRNNCRFKYIVDGSRTLPDFEMDNLAPFAIEGIEIYAGVAEIPATFRPLAAEPAGATCGVIAVWTRSGK